MKEEDGRWSASVPALPGCATWGHSREEALHNIQDAVIAYTQDMIDAGETVPSDATTRRFDEHVVAVNL